MYPHNQTARTARIVRAERMWAGVAALLLCYYGFFAGFIPLTPAAKLMVYTVRFGGVAMVVSVVGLQTGWVVALAYDGIASMLIGAGLAISGAMWLSGGGDFQGMLNIVFGVMFAASGWRNWTTFNNLRAAAATPSQPLHPPGGARGSVHGDAQAGATGDAHVGTPPAPGDSLAGRIRRQREQDRVQAQRISESGGFAAPRADVTSDAPAAVEAAPESAANPDMAPNPTTASNTASVPDPQSDLNPAPQSPDESDHTDAPGSEPPAPAPPEGFLAGFADPEKPPQAD